MRYAETDAMGIVHHAAYMVWFEAGRSELMFETGSSYTQLESEGYHLPVVEATARFLSPARYGDVVTVRTWVEELGSRGVTFGYEVVKEDGNLLATGRTVHICTDRAGNVRTTPRWARELLES
ncbi:MAG: acyl-CoA thioesterase [Chloroflexi bacterium]|nr:acyl-CoA thioesterase [Chloroflexota bacterium]